jgi:uncharacterized membrane protein YfcA
MAFLNFLAAISFLSKKSGDVAIFALLGATFAVGMGIGALVCRAMTDHLIPIDRSTA